MKEDIIFNSDLLANPSADVLQELIDQSATNAQITARNIARQFRSRPNDLVLRAQKEFLELQTLVRKGIEKSKDIGFSLMALNELLPHGSWESFLDKLGMSRQSAHIYIQLAKNWELIEPQIANMEQAEISTRECLRYVADVKRFIAQSAEQEATGEVQVIEKPEPIKTTKTKRKTHDLESMCLKARTAVGALLTYSGVPIVDATLEEIRASIPEASTKAEVDPE